MKENIFCAICTVNYLSYTHVLNKSIKKSGNLEKLFVLIIDFDEKYNDLLTEKDIVYIKLIDLKISNISELIEKYNAFELCNVLKPFFLEWILLNHKEINNLIYLDSDIYVYGKFDDVYNYLENNQNKSVLLIPSISYKNKMLVDNEYNAEIEFSKFGLYCGGFYVLRNDKNSLNFLKWHKKKLANYGYNAVYSYMFVDQKILDFAPLLFNFVGIYFNESYNVGHWNCFDYKIVEKNKKFLINDKPLIFFHFSILQIDEKNLSESKLLNIRLKELPVLYKLCINYWNELKNNRVLELKKINYGFENKYKKNVIPQIDNIGYLKHELFILQKAYDDLYFKLSQSLKDYKLIELKLKDEIYIKNKINNDLTMIQNSKSWKIITFLRNIKHKLLR